MFPKLLVICSILFLFLYLRFSYFYQHQPHYHDGQKASLQITLQEEPSSNAQGQKFAVKDDYGQKIFVRTAAYPAFHFGEKLTFLRVIHKTTLAKNREILTMTF